VGILVTGATPAGDGRALTFAVPIDRVKPLLGGLTVARGPASRAPTGAPPPPLGR
jgi:S1-C subfamily serine protease